MGFPKIRPFAAGPSAAYIWMVAVAFILAVSGSTVKNHIAAFVVDTAYAPFYSLNSGLKSILSVNRDNRELLARVVELTADNARLAEAGRENNRLREMLEFKLRSELTVIPAEVVGSPSVPVRGTVWISAGPDKTLQIGSPVVTPEGVVGNVAGYSGGLGIVRSLWDRNCRVAAVDLRSRATGIVQYVTGPYLTFNYVPVDGDIKVGDTVSSSGWGERYPKGLPIGEVHEVHVDSTAFFLAVEIKPFVHFETLEEVFVIQQSVADTLPEIEP